MHQIRRCLLVLLLLAWGVPLAQAAPAEGLTKVQVAAVADSAAPGPGEAADAEDLVRQKRLWGMAEAIRETLAEDLAEYARPGPEGRPTPLFEADGSDALTRAIVDEDPSRARSERDGVLHARLGLGTDDPSAQQALFPRWICDQLTEAGAQLAVVGYLRGEGTVLKVVMARPCALLGMRVDEASRDPATSLQNGLREVLDSRYEAFLQVTGEPGAAIVLDGRTVGQLPLAESIRTVPGPHRVRSQREAVCDETTLELEPGENLWAPVPCGGREEGGRLLTWIAAGAAVAFAGAAVVSHVGYLGAQDEAEDAKAQGRDRARTKALFDDADAAARRTNILWGVTGAAAVAAGVLYFVEAPSSTAVAASAGPDGGFVTIAGRF